MKTPWEPCKTLTSILRDERIPLKYDAKFREFFIPLQGSGVTAIQCLSYCPICGNKFPLSLRDAFFDELEKQGIDYENPDYGQNLPTSFLSDEWWKNLDL